MHAWGGGGNLVDILHAFRRFQNGMDHDRFFDTIARLKLGQQLVAIMNIPNPFHFGHHDDIKLVADLSDNLGEIIQHPWAVERIEARPQAG